MKIKTALLLIILFILASISNRTYASVIYSSPLNGSDNFTSSWSVINQNYGNFGPNGLTGPAIYKKDFNIHDIIISFDGIASSAYPTYIGVSCRSDETTSLTLENTYFDTNANDHITECINGSCSQIGTNFTGGTLNTLRHYELDCLGNKISVKVDGQMVDSITASSLFPSSNNTFAVINASTSLAHISNLKVCDAGGCDAPSPTPTPTPSPTPTPVQLNVPVLKQTDTPWQSQVYDSATKWAPNNPTIGNWGCAVTSAAMILNYYGINKMPDGSPVDPGTLNSWLKSQPDGYLGNGNVNWYAIPRFTYLARLAFNNPNYKYDALVYKRVAGADTTTLTNDLKNNQPDILEEPHHFVVATGIDNANATFTINDPYHDRSALTNGYNNTFLNLGQYIPSYTDLSYIVATGNLTQSFSATDATGTTAGDSYVQQPLENDANPGQLSGDPINIFHIDQPQGASYTLTVTDTKPEIFTLPVYLYDQSGNVNIQHIEGVSSGNNSNVFTLSFDKESSNKSTVTKDVTPGNLLTDINLLYSLHKLTRGQYYSLRAQANTIMRDAQRKLTFIEKIHIRVMTFLIKMERVEKDSADILTQDLSVLLNQQK